MERHGAAELDLFVNQENAAGLKPGRPRANAFSARIWSNEKAILIILAFLATVIVSFSLGVEKGRRSSVVQEDAPKPASREISAVGQNRAVDPPAIRSAGAYTIQVASFKSLPNSQKEAELLKGRGFQAITVSKDQHVIVCVGNFPDKETARSSVSQLSRYYKDCYIRRL